MNIHGVGILEIILAVIVTAIVAGPDRIVDAATRAVRVFIDEVHR
ncbi:MAG TPA: hypothetical protein VMR52_09505 [Dehalococcoidia bacterium]|nr:hypothetical protein [Dehalococcoidia bacterium]